ncbi:PLP-dependent transferase [Aureobasidium sp. EXF-12298]|nr:PLP-dependent transferase [Aureobasidium sp. EXF-12298]KAI4763834.1 PLP-dependent transferase [Aureobasidium sp. EXF-12344]KAI4782631.1 PLP-dependent transferase [Aureobasidium sp. EXF-3400]
MVCIHLFVIETRSYGTHPIEVRSVHRKYQERAEARPDTFVRYELRTRLLKEARKAIADYVHASLETCVLVPNASTGIDTVLRNLTFEPQDAVICFSTIYPAFMNTLEYLKERNEFSIYQIEHDLCLSDDEICNDFERMLGKISEDGKKAKLAIFDTITSLPAVRMPYERLTAICRSHGVLSCIDGAHGVGQLHLNLSQLDPDFFVSNCHKWLFTPRGCAVLYVPVRYQHLIRSTLPTGFNFLKRGKAAKINNFVANFAAVATSDDTPYLCIPAALEWRKCITFADKTGEEAIISYNKELARKGGQLVADMLGTEVLDNEGLTLGQCAMTNVRLPISPEKCSEKLADLLNMIMNRKYNIAVNIYYYKQALWVRLSAQIYLELQHFEAAGGALREILTTYAVDDSRLIT